LSLRKLAERKQLQLAAILLLLCGFVISCGAGQYEEEQSNLCSRSNCVSLSTENQHEDMKITSFTPDHPFIFSLNGFLALDIDV